jgi:hypothetical protein
MVRCNLSPTTGQAVKLPTHREGERKRQTDIYIEWLVMMMMMMMMIITCDNYD